jgi:hypothetical protein
MDELEFKVPPPKVLEDLKRKKQRPKRETEKDFPNKKNGLKKDLDKKKKDTNKNNLYNDPESEEDEHTQREIGEEQKKIGT